MKIYFFATCIGAGVFADTCIKAIKLLQNAGAEVIYKKDQTCCGQPSFNSGYYEETKKVALHNMSLFSENYPIVLPSGSCAGMMKHDYIELFKGTDLESKARDFAARIYEVSEFLVDVLKVNLVDKGETVELFFADRNHCRSGDFCAILMRNAA